MTGNKNIVQRFRFLNPTVSASSTSSSSSLFSASMIIYRRRPYRCIGLSPFTYIHNSHSSSVVLPSFSLFRTFSSTSSSSFPMYPSFFPSSSISSSNSLSTSSKQSLRIPPFLGGRRLSSSSKASSVKSVSLKGNTLHNHSGLSSSSSSSMKPQAGDPYFRDIWRKFQLLVHPDLFTSFPDIQQKNSDSLQKLQGILNDAKSMERDANELIKPRTETMEFFIRAHRIVTPRSPPSNGRTFPPKNSSSTPSSSSSSSSDNHFIRVPLVIRVTGSHFQHVLADSLIHLFKLCGLPSRWYWGNEYWNSTYKITEDFETKNSNNNNTTTNENKDNNYRNTNTYSSTNNNTRNRSDDDDDKTEEKTHGRQQRQRRASSSSSQ